MGDQVRALEHLQRLELRAGDRLVLTVPGRLSHEQATSIRARLREFVGDEVKVLILEAGLQLAAVGPALEAGAGEKPPRVSAGAGIQK